jgi:hypothetical protein
MSIDLTVRIYMGSNFGVFHRIGNWPSPHRLALPCDTVAQAVLISLLRCKVRTCGPGGLLRATRLTPLIMIASVAKRPLYFAVVFSYFFVRILSGGYHVETLDQRTPKFTCMIMMTKKRFDVHLTRIRRAVFERRRRKFRNISPIQTNGPRPLY